MSLKKHNQLNPWMKTNKFAGYLFASVIKIHYGTCSVFIIQAGIFNSVFYYFLYFRLLLYKRSGTLLRFVTVVLPLKRYKLAVIIGVYFILVYRIKNVHYDIAPFNLIITGSYPLTFSFNFSLLLYGYRN